MTHSTWDEVKAKREADRLARYNLALAPCNTLDDHARTAKAVADGEIAVYKKMLRDEREAVEDAWTKISALEADLTELNRLFRLESANVGRLDIENRELRQELEDVRRWETVAKENLSVVEEMSETIVSLRKELKENEGVMKVLRRQRDQADKQVAYLTTNPYRQEPLWGDIDG